MTPRRLRVWTWVLEFLGAGCAIERKATAPVQAAAPAPSIPAYPESIAAEAPLEADYGPRIQACHWLPTLSPSEFAFVPTNSVEEFFRQKLELAEGPVE